MTRALTKTPVPITLVTIRAVAGMSVSPLISVAELRAEDGLFDTKFLSVMVGRDECVAHRPVPVYFTAVRSNSMPASQATSIRASGAYSPGNASSPEFGALLWHASLFYSAWSLLSTMVLSTLSILTPAVVRIPLDFVQSGGVIGAFALADLFAVIYISYDTIAHKRLWRSCAVCDSTRIESGERRFREAIRIGPASMAPQ
jgi:hypothetical protein